MGICVRDLKHVAKSVLGCDLENEGDHIRYTLKVNDRVIANFKFSRSWKGHQQISDFILHKQAESMHCPLQMWKSLLQGRTTKDTYFGELRRQGLINLEEYDILCGNPPNPRDHKG